jgi:hypothetical protein
MPNSSIIPLSPSLTLTCSKCQKLLVYWGGVYFHVLSAEYEEASKEYIVVLTDEGYLQVQRYVKANP